MKLAISDAVKPDLVYKDHRIVVSIVGRGWRALILCAPIEHCPARQPSLARRVSEGGHRRGGEMDCGRTLHGDVQLGSPKKSAKGFPWH